MQRAYCYLTALAKHSHGTGWRPHMQQTYCYLLPRRKSTQLLVQAPKGGLLAKLGYEGNSRMVT